MDDGIKHVPNENQGRVVSIQWNNGPESSMEYTDWWEGEQTLHCL